MDGEDNCPESRNYNQYDKDKDGVGDVCDDSDDRFWEQNKGLVYLLTIVIAGLFVYFSYVILTDKKK